MTFNPWRVLRGAPEIALKFSRTPGLLGTWDQARSIITLHPGQSQRQRRCTLAHELIHAERGDDGECDEATERRVHAEAARRLVPIEALAEAAAFHGNDLDELAHELWVDLDTLHARLNHLHPSERGYLLRRLAMKEHPA